MDLLQIESIVTTQLKVRVPKILNNRYPNISFTNEINDNTPSFPNVFIQELEPSEVGRTIANDSIHAFRDTIQIIVSTNVSKSEAKAVANACVNAMKGLSFSLVTGPHYILDNNVHKYFIRTRRIIASGDNF
jgi:hypothetical protein